MCHSLLAPRSRPSVVWHTRSMHRSYLVRVRRALIAARLAQARVHAAHRAPVCGDVCLLLPVCSCLCCGAAGVPQNGRELSEVLHWRVRQERGAAGLQRMQLPQDRAGLHRARRRLHSGACTPSQGSHAHESCGMTHWLALRSFGTTLPTPACAVRRAVRQGCRAHCCAHARRATARA